MNDAESTNAESLTEGDHDAVVEVDDFQVDVVDVEVIEVEVVEVEIDVDVVDEPVDTEPNYSRNAQPTQGALALNIRTGDDRVDDAVASLQVLDDLPVDQHAQVFDHVHQALQGALTDIGRD